MFKLTKPKREEEELSELMVELDHIWTAHVTLKCSPVKKLKMLRKKLIKLKLLKLIRNNWKLVNNDYNIKSDRHSFVAYINTIQKLSNIFISDSNRLINQRAYFYYKIQVYEVFSKLVP